jgi:cell division initiation protein
MYSTDTALNDRRLPLPDMPVMPLDVRQAKFATVMRGYDKQQVSTLLEHASEGFELALRDNERLRQEIARLEGALAQFRDLEGSLKNTLMSAQKLADDMRETAEKDATRIVREAEGRAEMILQKALARLEDIQREIDGLRMKRREAETAIEGLMSALGHTLTFVRESDQRDRSGGERSDKVIAQRVRTEPPSGGIRQDPQPVALIPESRPMAPVPVA